MSIDDPNMNLPTAAARVDERTDVDPRPKALSPTEIKAGLIEQQRTQRADVERLTREVADKTKELKAAKEGLTETERYIKYMTPRKSPKGTKAAKATAAKPTNG